MELPIFRREILIKQLLKKQWWAIEKLEAEGYNPITILLHNTSIEDVISIFEKLVK